jgi:hypothetical protein
VDLQAAQRSLYDATDEDPHVLSIQPIPESSNSAGSSKNYGCKVLPPVL